MSPREKGEHEQEVAHVAVSSLRLGDSPRLDGESVEHVARLAETDAQLPPILVNRQTMQVIDGTHRLLAAELRGYETIGVVFFDGSAEDAFLWAVKANVDHGLPLSLADRRAAAARILATHPGMSDRSIARTSGLGAKTVAAIRRRSTDVGQQLNKRIGRDGKVRPLNSAEGRHRAAEVMAERPNASLREVARLAGISPATVSDVRKRLRAGEPPAPVQPEAADRDHDSAATNAASRPRRDRQTRLTPSDPRYMLEKLLRDPSLRHKEEGRQLLRLLQHNAMVTQEWSGLTAAVPMHCGSLIVDLARQFAATWSGFADELDDRVRSVDGSAVS
ncbi:ParB N-terminal domain-containing protein [Streptomyces sp. NPDC058985]|uniref:ParB/RepB/Spo0J family partition protein n=1 Tax=Streptomyces sp. NPDC058985 TaxID=3346684 RepID=UPI00367DD12A